MKKKQDTAEKLLKKIRTSSICDGLTPKGATPLLSFSARSKILLVGQAPGIRAMESGVPWDDASGVRLREWMGITDEQFYNADNVAIVPMDFCYPGKGKSGDNPPRPICSETWMEKIREQLQEVRITIVIGQYAQKYLLGDTRKKTLTETVRSWREYAPEYYVLPHPSPRNNIWMAKNPWFATEVLPAFKKAVARQLDS